MFMYMFLVIMCKLLSEIPGPGVLVKYGNDTCVVTHSVYGGYTGIVEMFSCTGNS